MTVSRHDRSLFGWKGFVKDPSWLTTIAVCVGAVNFFLLAYAASGLLVENPNLPGDYDLLDHAPGPGFYLEAVIAFSISLVSAVLIQSEETEVRWGARFFVCGVPASSAFLLIYFGYVHW